MKKDDNKQDIIPPIIVGKDEKFPYSKGIISRSLQDAGLSLEEAYGIATSIEDKLQSDEVDSLTSDELHQMVIDILTERFGEDVARAFEKVSKKPSVIMIDEPDLSFPFSKGILSQSLLASGLTPEESYSLATKIQNELISEGRERINRSELKMIVSNFIEENYGELYARNYLIWRKMRHPDKPLFILIGGGTGVGKTTLARELAHRIGFRRVVSTDIIREVMRMMFSDELLPSIYRSSYEAYKAIPESEMYENPKIAGFIEQAKLVNVGVKGLIERAITENLSMIIDGIHILPSLISKEEFSDAYIIIFFVSTLDERVHRSRFYYRAEESSRRPTDKYLKNFQSIREIQQYIIDQSVEFGLPVIDSISLDNTISKTLSLITDEVSKYVSVDIKEVDD